MTDPAGPPLLEVRSVVKRFPGVTALDGVALTLQPGEILAVVGENGAGKSTLMKILAGIQRPDRGEIRLRDQPIEIESVRKAGELGIALIHQELNLCDNLDVAGSIFLGREFRRFGWIDRRKMYEAAAGVLNRVGLDLDPRTIVGSLSIGQQQMIEIAKALSSDARVLIMDEPTSSLSQRETDALFRVVRDLREKGVSIIYISHRLGEVRELADRVVVLRDGENAGELAKHEIDHDRIVKLMVGRDVSRFYARRPHQPGEVALELKQIRTAAFPSRAISFQLRAGEMVGMAGLVGAGRSELLRVLFGIDPLIGGQIHVAGNSIAIESSRDAMRAGIALVPEDRKQQGLILDMAVGGNLNLAALSVNRRPGGVLNLAALSGNSSDRIEQLRIRTPSDRQLSRYLSGGNQQKVVLGKWLSLKPRILLLDEPTRGIDVGAKQEIYVLMEQLAEQGVAILFVSSEMEEILGMSDRTLVMHEGRIAGELARDELSEENVMQLATGRTLLPRTDTAR